MLYAPWQETDDLGDRKPLTCDLTLPREQMWEQNRITIPVDAGDRFDGIDHGLTWGDGRKGRFGNSEVAAYRQASHTDHCGEFRRGHLSPAVER